MLIDTHCHIHESTYPLDVETTIQHAQSRGVDQLICVGTSPESSSQAVRLAGSRDDVYAAVGVHPHETKGGWQEIAQLLAGRSLKIEDSKIVAIGEIGLDYFYDHSPRDVQIKALRWQIELALENKLPIIFHVREAFDDFWPIYDSYQGIRGVLHSFTDNQANLEAGLSRGLYIGVNGISTFTRDEDQKAAYESIPLDRLLLETDAPFLTPAPLRGKVNEPPFVSIIAEHHATIRGISIEAIATSTTANARALFAL